MRSLICTDMKIPFPFGQTLFHSSIRCTAFVIYIGKRTPREVRNVALRILKRIGANIGS
jgi:hypothetical protein